MGVFAPWFLAGIAAVGLPVYLHLLRRHSTTPRPFSSLMFFEPRTQSSIRHRRLRYLLLLSLRVALLVLLALAFANPFINRPAARARGERLLLLAIDDSFSMRAGTRMADAKRAALSVLASRRSAEPVQVMAIDAQLHALTPPTRDTATARAAIESIEAGDSRSRFAELARAVRLVGDETHAPIELHLFSDMQRSSMA
ncbi:MAG TPA: BatA domain-containing protein, partial [Vicinamibacterales bacterium]|nr:BatA domain-containing protein [Vicinamibacterales bacterium]